MDIQLIRDIANAKSVYEVEELLYDMEEDTVRYLCCLDPDLLGIWVGAAISMIDKTSLYAYVQQACDMALWEVGV